MDQPVSAPSVILVVDDEPIIRLDAVAIIEDAGFVVFEAADAEEALEMMAAHPDVSVLFTDVNMPGSFDGLELARRVHEKWPAVQLIITSGRGVPSSAEIPDHGHFMAKPYQTRAVVDLLRSICWRSPLQQPSAGDRCAQGQPKCFETRADDCNAQAVTRATWTHRSWCVLGSPRPIETFVPDGLSTCGAW